MAWSELISRRTRSGKHWQDDATGKCRFEQVAKVALHYPTAGPDSDVLDGVTNMTPVRVNNAQFDGWRVTANTWQYALGIDKVNHPGEDGWVGFGGRQGAHWFKFRLVRAGYLKWSTREWGDMGGTPDYTRAGKLSRTTQAVVVGPPGAEQTINVSTQARWNDLWPALPQGQVDVVWRAEGRQLKEEVVVNQAAREWIAANRPPGYYFPGVSLNDAYFGFVFKLDWSDVPRIYRGVVQVQPGDDYPDDGENIYLRDALDRLLAFMPIDNCYVPGTEASAPIRKRLYFDGVDHYLLMGVRCDLLAGLPAGDLVFDPTFTDGYGGDVNTAVDTQVLDAQPTYNTGTSTTLKCQEGATTKTRSLLRFDCSSIPAGSTCDSATLYLYYAYDSGKSGNTNIYSVASGNTAWIEGTKSYSQAGSGEPCWNALAADGAGGVTTAWAGSAGLSTSGTDYEETSIGTHSFSSADSVGQEYTAALTTTRIDDWFGSPNTNYGLLLRVVETTGVDVHYGSAEHATTGYRPKLVVEYTEAGAAPVWPLPGLITLQATNRAATY